MALTELPSYYFSREIEEIPNTRLFVRVGERIGGKVGRTIARWSPSILSYNHGVLTEFNSPKRSLTTTVELGLVETGGLITVFFRPALGGLIYLVGRVANHLGEKYYRNKVVLSRRDKVAELMSST